ncbi:PrsW family glutamic-type intramembrane protease [Staphylococcus gallinarum]|uniref:PrsW family glutamic-type intramembrane protease n=3 Tax=Staphylococcus gallinarum TaxID=1293 RepID=UPI001E548F54|nr:PrsW family glutamic-type intramembrane protease [Staphylococcus gallinarum]MCD8826604.1 PrsW family intramembrane metalloprotease [Staphylococcus gallinarum]
MKCEKCGSIVSEKDNFCNSCGHQLVHNNKGKKDGNFVNKCPKCGSEVGEQDNFCMSCGQLLERNQSKNNVNNSEIAHDFEQFNKNDSKVYSDGTAKSFEKKSVDEIDLKSEAKNLFNNTTKSIGKFAGSEESLKLNLRDMFSEVFKPHTKDESDEVFIAGTKTTTPDLNDVSQEWGKPWVFSRVFLAFSITFAALWVLAVVFQNEKAIPGLIFIGALTVPLAGLFFFFESNAFKNISLFEVLKMFFIGGVFSLISTMILYQFISFSDDYYLFGTMTVTDAILVGLVEETGKALIIIYFINKHKTNKILNGLLIGGAIGAGFAVFESAGYILEFSSDVENEMIHMVFLRGWTAIGGHLVWSAIVGAAIVIAKEEKNFVFNNVIDKRFLFFYFTSVILHAIWDTSFSFEETGIVKYIVLIVIVWTYIFILMKAGLNQVNVLQNKAKESMEKN